MHLYSNLPQSLYQESAAKLPLSDACYTTQTHKQIYIKRAPRPQGQALKT